MHINHEIGAVIGFFIVFLRYFLANHRYSVVITLRQVEIDFVDSVAHKCIFNTFRRFWEHVEMIQP